MKNQIKTKRKGGRPKGEPTYMQSFRTKYDMKDFLATIDNKAKFINLAIRETPEFKAFLATQIANSKDRALFN